MAIGLKSHIWDNNIRSIILLALYPLVLLAMLWAAGAGIGMASGQHPDPAGFGMAIVLEYWPILGAVVAIWFTVSWFFHGSMIRMASHSHPVTRAEEPELYNMIENLCISRGMAMPRLEIIETPARNAFASGINDRTYAITVTRGLLTGLRPDEIEGVMAHELTHIINRDVRLLMVCVIFTGMIGFMTQILWSNMRYGMWAPRSSGGGNNRGNPFLLYLIVLGVLVVGYLASMLTRFALSRAREYMADAGAVELTRNPEAMMRALLRIAGHDRMPAAPADIEMMCIENSAPFLGLFATHPPIEKRVKALSQATSTPVPILSGPRGTAGADWDIPTKQGKIDNPWQ